MKLAIAHITQKDGMREGAACIEMILRYYNVEVSPQTIEKFLDEAHGGTDIAQIGRIFLQCGFDTELVTMHPRLFSMDDKRLSQEDLLEELEQRMQFAVERTHDQKMIENCITYMRDGGRTTPEVPSFDRVKAELDRGRPVLGLFVTKFITPGVTGAHTHFVAISGYRGKNIFVHDPHIQKVNTHFFLQRHSQKIAADDFFSGIYSQESEYIDSGGMLLIKQKAS